MLHPDPVLTASIYSGRIDGVIRGAVGPLRSGLAEAFPDGAWRLWMLRYARGGCHLKVRVHGPEAVRPVAERLLDDAVRSHFLRVAAPPEGTVRLTRPTSPAIDEDDESSEDHPDRTLRWTRYRRTHVCLGPKLFLGDDRYVALFTTCLSRAGEVVFEALGPAGDEELAGSVRLKALLNALLAGLSATGLAPGERAAYLAYHRDWLLRFVLPTRAREEETLAGFERRAEGMGSVLEEARRTAARWEEAPALPSAAPAAAWRRSLADLFRHLDTFRGDPAYRSDPFSDDPAFPPLFKALHGLANQLGVDMLNEAFVHHLLLRATTVEPTGAAAGARA